MKEVQKAVLVICCLLEKGRRRRSDAALGWRLTIICEHARRSLANRFSLTDICVFCTCSLEGSGARRDERTYQNGRRRLEKGGRTMAPFVSTFNTKCAPLRIYRLRRPSGIVNYFLRKTIFHREKGHADREAQTAMQQQSSPSKCQKSEHLDRQCGRLFFFPLLHAGSASRARNLRCLPAFRSVAGQIR